MSECFLCGISESKSFLMEVITEEGIKKICRNCFVKEKERYPLIKKKKIDLKKENTRDILERVSGFKLNEIKKENKQDENLRTLIDKNFKENFQPATEKKELIKNFHWIIMLLRRKKKLTQRQLAEAILESEEAIKLAEKGILPKDWRKLISKLEKYFGVNLTRRENTSSESKDKIPQLFQIPQEKDIEIDFSSLDTKDITIGDLKEIKKKKNGFFKKLFGSEKREIKENKNIENSELESEEKLE